MKIKYLALLLLALTACTAERTGEDVMKTPRLSVRSVESSEAPSAESTALTLQWEADNSLEINVEFSPIASFEGPAIYTQKMPSGAGELQLTYRELNDILLGALGMEAGIEAPLYIRLIAQSGALTAVSNTAKVAVTPGALFSAPMLTCSTAELLLVKNYPERLAMSLSWTKNGAEVENAIEFSTNQDFLLPYTERVDSGIHDRQYTYGELNSILCDSLMMEADVAAPLYIRIVSSFETAAAYSNTVTINVTPNATAPYTGPEKLYVAGASAADPWNFDDYLLQYNASTMSYGGVLNVDSKWGYKFYPQIDNWDYCYTRSSGDAMSGKLMLGSQSSGNVPAPTPGVYLFDVSLGNFTYQLVKVESAYYTGFNDSWSLQKMTQSADNPTVYTATVTITKPTPYRWQVVINGEWAYKLCASNGHLLLYDEGNADEEIANGTYKLTVNLAEGTYTLEN